MALRNVFDRNGTEGISFRQLSRELGLGIPAAWYLQQRIREACGDQTTNILCGIVEVDEVYVGGREGNKPPHKRHGGRGPVGKTAVLGLRERNGRVMARVVKSTSKQMLQGIIRRNVVSAAPFLAALFIVFCLLIYGYVLTADFIRSCDRWIRRLKNDLDHFG